MEINEAERIVIAKPVPSRPTCFGFRSFSALLAGAINSSPSNACSETAVTAIRPKTVRVKPVANRSSIGVLSSLAPVPSYKEDKLLNSDSKSTVLCKPLAKVVSKMTLSHFENLGNSNISHQQALAHVKAHAKPPNQFKYHFRSDHSSNDLCRNFPSQSDGEKKNEPPKMASENMEERKKSLPPSNNGARTSYDGYNWRKYGQKQIKGSDYPRSYYKCTHPNCPVKKVERSLEGGIAEIVYKGEHKHSKPLPPRSNPFVLGGTGQETNNTNQLKERNDGSEGRTENQNQVRNLNAGTPENSYGLSGDCEEGSKGLEAEADEPRSKRRKTEYEPGMSGKGVQEQGALMQSSIDSEIIGDGFRWRKYGQKVVKGNPYPRSYYRCTNPKCNVRKHVERASDDPKTFITTYEGKHNHDMPIKNSNPVESEPDSQAAISMDKP